MSFEKVFFDSLGSHSLDDCDDETIVRAIKRVLRLLDLNTKSLFLYFLDRRVTRGDKERLDNIVLSYFTREMHDKRSKREGTSRRPPFDYDDDDDDYDVEERGAVAPRPDEKPRRRAPTRDTRAPGKIMALNLHEEVNEDLLERFAQEHKLQLCLLFDCTLCLEGFHLGVHALIKELQLKYEPQVIIEADKHFIERQLLRHFVPATKKRPEPSIDLSGFAVAVGEKLKGHVGEMFLRKVALKKAHYAVKK